MRDPEEGYEADDSIATLVTQALGRARINQVLILTGDRDSIPLVTERVDGDFTRCAVSRTWPG